MPTHYDVIASRDCRTATRKHYTTARETDAALLYVHQHVTDLLLSSSRLDAAVQPGSCYTWSLAQAYDGNGGTIAAIDEVNVLSVCVMRTMALRRYHSLPFAVCKMRSACEC